MALLRKAPADGKSGWCVGDILACGVLAGLPILIYAIPSALGHPNLPGDDLIQNFPLRVLVGRQLGHGTFPTFNPYVWGGAPLLGGWNAGALYPFTMLFAFVPAAGAWALNEMAVYWVGALGMYAFLRVVRLRPFPSLLGAVSFAFAGALDVQLVHFGLVAGMSWIPLILVALVKLTRELTWARRTTWVGVLGVAGSMSVLAGEPRAIDTTLAVAVLYFAWLVTRVGPRLVGFVVSTFAGVGLATLISAVQWLPGAMTVSTSQRATATYALFSAGSLDPRWLFTLFTPNLLGGSGSFGTSTWFASYGLPEVMGYAGLLAIVSAFGLLGTLRRRRPLPDWLAWEVIAAVGILLALGGNTPLGHFFAHLPLFGSQRLQSRNIAVTDLALSVLLAYWVDQVLRRRVEPNAVPKRWGNFDRFRLMSVLPVGVAGLLSVAALATPAGVARLLGATAAQATRASAERPLFVVNLLLVAVAAAFILGLPRLRVSRRGWILGTIAVIDLAAFNVTSLWPIAVGPADVTNLGSAAIPPTQNASPALLHLAATLGSSTRYVIYNPQHYVPESPQAPQLPDLNVLDGRFIAQGYSSIVEADYADTTGSHAPNGKGLETLSPKAIADGVLNQMDTTTLVTLPLYLVVDHTRGSQPSASGSNQPATGSPTGMRTLRTGVDASWVFGEKLDITSFSLPLKSRGAQTPLAGWSVGLTKANGTISWQSSVHVIEGSRSIEVKFAQPSSGTGLVMKSTLYQGAVGPPTITTRGGLISTADGDLADALASGWSFAGDLGQYAYFTNRHADAPLTLVPLPGVSTTGASVRALSGPKVEPTSAVVSSPHGIEVVRSVTVIPGWSATWHPNRGTTRSLLVKRRGLVQAVKVPAGEGIVTWSYDAPGVKGGIVMTIVGLALLVGLIGTAITLRRVGWNRRPLGRVECTSS
jgi:hypothetical protein